MFLKGTAYLAAQAVRKCFAMNPALAAEGRLPLQTARFPEYSSAPGGVTARVCPARRSVQLWFRYSF